MKITYPKVPATSVQVICEEEDGAHLASPKSESCINQAEYMEFFYETFLNLKAKRLGSKK